MLKFSVWLQSDMISSWTKSNIEICVGSGTTISNVVKLIQGPTIVTHIGVYEPLWTYDHCYWVVLWPLMFSSCQRYEKVHNLNWHSSLILNYNKDQDSVVNYLYVYNSGTIAAASHIMLIAFFLCEAL